MDIGTHVKLKYIKHPLFIPMTAEKWNQVQADLKRTLNQIKGEKMSGQEHQLEPMNGTQAKEKIFAGEQVNCSKADYHRDVRNGILDYQQRSKDLGRTDLEDRCKAEVERLDKIHGAQ